MDLRKIAAALPLITLVMSIAMDSDATRGVHNGGRAATPGATVSTKSNGASAGLQLEGVRVRRCATEANPIAKG